MELDLTEDQEFFVETTRRFLEAECADRRPCRTLADDPWASTAGVGAGRRAGLDLAARARGRRWGQPQRRGSARPRASSPRRWVGWSRPVRSGPPTSSPPRWPTAVRPSCGPRASRDHRRRDRRRVVRRRPRWWLGRGGRRNHRHARRRRLRARRDRDAGRSGRAGRRAARHRAHRSRAHPVPGPGRCPGRRDRRTRFRRPRPPLRRRFASTRCSRPPRSSWVTSTARPRRSSGSCSSPSCCSAPTPSGALDRVVEFTLEYLADRSSFGRPLASYQAIKHRFADMKMWLEAAHGVTELAARACRTPIPRRPRS